MSAITRKMRTTSSTGGALVSELWRGYVVEVFSDNTAQVVVPRLAGDDPIGRIPSLVPDLAVDARVIVGAIEGRIEDLVVLSAISADGVVVGDARFTDVLLDNAPTLDGHAARKSYVDAGDAATLVTSKSYTDAQVGTRALTAHTHVITDISNSTTVGRALMGATSTTAARSAIGAGTSSLVVGTGATNAKAGNWFPSFAEVTGTISTAQLPPLAINEVFAPVVSQAAMLALVAQRGDMAIRSDTGKTYVLGSDSPATLADWKEVMAAGQVQSVAGKTGLVLLVKADVGLSAVDNTSDLAKPISTATQTALNGKSDVTHTHAAATSGADGFMSAADKALLDGATPSPTGDAIVRRSASGAIAIITGGAATDAANKGYVDGEIASHTHALSSMTGLLDQSQMPAIVEIPSATDLNSYTTTGVFHQSQNADTTTGSNYPVNTAGLLIVNANNAMVYQEYCSYNTSRRWWRAKYSTSWSAWQAIAWSSEILSATHKAMVEAATDANTFDTIVKRSTAGWINAFNVNVTGQPTSSGHLTRKSYVDDILPKARVVEYSCAVVQNGPGSGVYAGVGTVEVAENNTFATARSTGNRGFVISEAGNYSIDIMWLPQTEPGNVTTSMYVNSIRVGTFSRLGTYGDWEFQCVVPAVRIPAGGVVEFLQANSSGAACAARVKIAKRTA